MRFVWQWLAVSSLLCATLAALAETRPQYGGTLHLMMRAAPSSLDPADSTQPDSFARRSLGKLLFDTLTTTDDSGRARAALAESWQATRGNLRWQFRLRRGVTFDDGTPLTPEVAAESLRFANPAWNVTVENETLVIDCKTPNPDLLMELALSRNAILKRDSINGVSGTGPFHIVEWQAGKKLKLAAQENYWGGRPFLDAIEIEMGRDVRDQMTALELGRADLVEVAPEQVRRISQDGPRLANSPPIELVALLFTRDVSSPEEKSLREALRWSIERGSIRSVLLQGAGQPTASILPTWMSGYGFVFPSGADVEKARQLRAQARTAPKWTLGYDGNDTMTRWLAERIALNARDAGLTLQPTSSASADLRVVRIPLASADPWITLEDVAARVGLPAVKNTKGSAEDLYAAERSALSTERLIPLFQLPVTYSASRLRNWTIRTDGSLDLTDAWLGRSGP